MATGTTPLNVKLMGKLKNPVSTDYNRLIGIPFLGLQDLHPMNWLLRVFTPLCVAFLLLVGSTSAMWWVQEWKSGIVYPEPQVISPAAPQTPPSDALVLFDGKDLSAFHDGEKWTITDEGYAIVNGGGITSKQAFGDMQLHVEFASPPEVKGNGQGRGNSGIYLMGRYELQVLDSYNNTTYFDGQCGSIYKQAPPIVNACLPPGEWQTYDILFTAPIFAEDGTLETPAYVTVFQNGVVIHNHYEIQGGTSYTAPPEYQKHGAKQPFSIQNHGDKVRFRNIWVRENVHGLAGKLPEDKPAEENPAEENESADEKKPDQPKVDEKPSEDKASE